MEGVFSFWAEEHFCRGILNKSHNILKQAGHLPPTVTH